MNAEPRNFFWQSVLLHAPGVTIASYFLTLQFTATINLSYLVLLIGSLFLLSVQSSLQWRMLWSWPTTLACALFLSTVISALLADKNNVNPNIVVSQIPGLLIYLLVVLCINSAAQLRFVIYGLFISLFVATWGFFWASSHAEFAHSIKLIFLAAHPLFLAANDALMFSIFTPLAIWFSLHRKNVFGSLFLIGYVAFSGILSVLLLSRISLIVIVASVVFYFLPTIRYRWLSLAALSLAVCAVLIYFSGSALAEKFHSLDLTRLRVWLVAIRMFIDAPWFGNGPGSFTVLYAQYVTQMPVVSSLGNEGRNMGWAHSLFFEAAAEKGLLGLSVFVVYFIYAFAAIKAKLREGSDDLVKAVGLSMAMCLIAAFIELSLLRVWGIYTIYFLLGLVAVFTAPRQYLLNKIDV